VASTLLTGDYFNLYTIVLIYKTWGEKVTIYIVFTCLIPIFSQELSFEALFITIIKTFRFYEIIFRNYELVFRTNESILRKKELIFRNYE
jgi:hypothetical protein